MERGSSFEQEFRSGIRKPICLYSARKQNTCHVEPPRVKQNISPTNSFFQAFRSELGMIRDNLKFHEEEFVYILEYYKTFSYMQQNVSHTNSALILQGPRIFYRKGNSGFTG
jgi:hypothetical protein